jgi:UDP-N-acetylmuramyl pentapeptide phosphotransferase/UDP-N-acetylglucosamine-1-phosphate transferase
VGGAAPLVFFTSLAVSWALIALMLPVFRRFALAVPTPRSSHKAVTPQGGGFGVVAASVGVTALMLLGSSQLVDPTPGDPWLVLAAAVLLAVVGAVDDARHLSPAPKFAAQAVAVLLVLAALPEDMRICPLLSWAIERAAMFVAGLWLVNLVNFMDGIDWMMVAEVVPVTAGVALIGWLGALPPEALVAALALNGAMLGFAPFNFPVARLFLGDLGSLPIGLLLLWLLLLVAGSGHLAAALLLPLYFVADATVTLARRALAHERIWEAHRTHFYQQARDNGFGTLGVVGRVFAVNCGLVVLSAVSVVMASPLASLVVLVLGASLVAWLLATFARRRR